MATDTPTLVRRTRKRDMRDGSRVVAILEMRRALPGERFCPDGLSPAFSLTGEVFEMHGTRTGGARERHYRRLLGEGANYGPASEPDTSGMCHDAILRAFPEVEMEQFAAMHLSDPETGEPMHADANGWYWYAGSRFDLRASERLTGFDGIYRHQLDSYGLKDGEVGRESYCRLAACRVLRVHPDLLPNDLDRDDFKAFVNAQRKRWSHEAADARAYIESLPNRS